MKTKKPCPFCKKKKCKILKIVETINDAVVSEYRIRACKAFGKARKDGLLHMLCKPIPRSQIKKHMKLMRFSPSMRR